jgi:hypothetical protein
MARDSSEGSEILEALRVVLELPVAVAVDQAMSLPAGESYTKGMSRMLVSILDERKDAA